MTKVISILGCGWLGLPLAENLKQNYKVNGSTTSLEKIQLLRNKDIHPYHLLIDDSLNKEFGNDVEAFFDCDVLFINIPPKVRSAGNDYHPRQMKTIIRYIKKCDIKKVIYVSATSIYPQDYEIVDERTPIDILTTGNKALYEAEHLLEKEKGFESLILRCGGLLGCNRIPGRYYSGKTIATGETPVNYIHRDDVVNIVTFAIENEVSSGLYNLVAPKHPLRKEVFSKNAEDFGFEPPIFSDEAPTEKKKKVLGEKLIEKLGYQFLYPDPLYFHFTL